MNRVPPGMVATVAVIAAVRFMSYAVQSRVAAAPHSSIPLLSGACLAVAFAGYLLFRIGRWLDGDWDARIYTISLLMATVILGYWSVRTMVDPYFPHPGDTQQQIIRELR
ncbi:MAG: hypothetical protein ACYCW6_22065 [Candidatus Xenobia bacterium]